MRVRRIRTPSSIRHTFRKTTRIIIPQPPLRPVRLRKRDIVRWDVLEESPWWFILHRRGVRRPRIGDDPLEARAISKSQLRGTLPERIVYKYLVEQLHFVPGVDFRFQSSMDGGRLELGGMVADFLFPIHKIILNPAGPHHERFIGQVKNEEVTMRLAEMGYTHYLFGLDIVFDEFRFEDFMRRIFNINISSGNAGTYVEVARLPSVLVQQQVETQANDYGIIYQLAMQAYNDITEVAGGYFR